MILRLAPSAQDRLERFLREHTADPALRLPPLRFLAGAPAGLVTRLLGASAVTFGHRVLLSPALVKEDAEGRLSAPADLVVHEAVHALQYRSAGVARFLARYARDYLTALRRLRGLDARARQAAYRAIPAERSARAAAAGYRAWSGADGGAEGRLTVLVRA